MRSSLFMLSMVSSRRSMTASSMFKRHRGWSAGLAVALASTLAACDPQVGDDYPGEPLAELGGTISVAEGTSPPADSEATIVWHVWDEGDNASVTDSVAVDGDFPFTFSLSLFAPPPESSQFDLGQEEESLAGVHIATGYVMVLPSGVGQLSMEENFEVALGVDNNHLLVWSDGAVPAGVLKGTFPGGLHEGYQLFHVEIPDNTAALACEEEAYQCISDCGSVPCSDDTCFEIADCLDACPDADACPPFIDYDALTPVALDSELTIVVGGEKHFPDWF